MGNITLLTTAMDNVDAWRIGEICTQANVLSAGDYIDRGLGLLRLLEAQGYSIAKADDALPRPR